MLEDGSVVVMDESLKKKILKDVDSMAARALRCLAFARKVSPFPCISPCTVHLDYFLLLFAFMESCWL